MQKKCREKASLIHTSVCYKERLIVSKLSDQLLPEKNMRKTIRKYIRCTSKREGKTNGIERTISQNQKTDMNAKPRTF